MHEKLNIRFANIDDMKKVFDLSNEDTVRANSIHTEKIEWENHVSWFKKRITNINEPFYVVEDTNGNFIGQLRFDKHDEEFVVSVSISSEFRGKGLASEILTEAIKKSGLKKISAYIFDFNDISKKLFEKVGFKKDKLDKYVFEPTTEIFGGGVNPLYESFSNFLLMVKNILKMFIFKHLNFISLLFCRRGISYV